MKKPEEIKKGLEFASIDCRDAHDCDKTCAYYKECSNPFYESACVPCTMLFDALALIQQLESKLNQAVEDIRMLGCIGNWLCPVCAYYNHGEGTKGKCVKCLTGDGFRWRGEKEEDK